MVYNSLDWHLSRIRNALEMCLLDILQGNHFVRKIKGKSRYRGERLSDTSLAGNEAHTPSHIRLWAPHSIAGSASDAEV